MNREQENRPDMAEQNRGQTQPEDARSIFEKMRAKAVDEAGKGRVLKDSDFKIAKEKVTKEFFNQGWEWVADAPKFEHDGRAITTDIPETYNKNNGVITAVDSEGKKFAAPFSSDMEKSLEAAGFHKNEKMSVPYSNEGPKHPNAQERWNKLWQEHNKKEKKAA
jgi:hypothetical protein